MYEMTDSASENSGHFAGVIGPERNFDIINKKINIGQRATQLFMIDGFTKDEIMEKLIESLIALKPEDIPQKAGDFAKLVPYIDVTPKSTLKEAVDYLLMGMVCMFVDGYKCCFVIDCRTYPARSVSEPWKDRVLRGSRDGFVESIVANVTLIRRRIRTPDFCVEVMNAGTMSNTDIAFAYIQGKADMKLLAFINPFPKFKYSERPDSAAASIYDGNIVILIDNSPAVLVVPTSVFDVIEEADDYYFPPLTGTYIKLSKYLLTIMSLIMTPLWIVFLRNPGMVPEWFKFIMIEEGSTVPVILQLLILEFCIDGLRLAAVNTPTLLTTPLSIIAGIVVGEYAVSSGWFDPESMLYMAFVTVGTYTQASYELGYAIKFFRMIMLILAWFFGIWGFAAGIVMFVLAMAFNRTISEKSYLYPLIPFDGKMLARKLLRLRLGKEK